MEGVQLSDFFTTVPLCQMSEVKWRWDFLAHIVWSQSILSISGFLISFMAEKPETNLFFIFRTV